MKYAAGEWRRLNDEKITNEVLKHLGEKRTFLNEIGHIQRRYCLLRDAVKGQITELKGVGRRTQLLDDLRSRKTYWELKIKKFGNYILPIEHKEVSPLSP